MKGNKRLKEKGITLVALVITIIILLILAGIAIASLTGDNGLFARARQAKTETEVAEVKERAQTDILEEQTGNNGNLAKSKFIEILNKYFKDVPTEENFPEDLTTLTLETREEYGSHSIKISEIYNGSFPKTIDSLKVGDKVYYDTGNKNVGNQGIIECTVLYDKAYNEANGTNYGIQIISSDIIKTTDGITETVTLGVDDPEITEGTNNFEKAKNSYNNALKTLYDKAQEYLNPEYATAARCVGSDPADPDWDTTTNEAGYYTKEIAEEKNEYQNYMETYYNTLKNGDEKYNTDWEQIRNIAELQKTSDKYWIASRSVRSDSSTTNFIMYFMFPEGELSSINLCIVYSNGGAGGTNGYGRSYGFRPIFTLKSGIEISNNNGTNETYTLIP